MSAGLLTGPPVRPVVPARLLDGPACRHLSDHLVRWGPLPRPGAALIDEVVAAGLTGRGGAGFPTGRKLAAVTAQVRATGGPAVVVVNAVEGDPTSAKDAVLAGHAPQLILDGAELAAHAVGTDTVLVAVRDQGGPQRCLSAAVADRPPSGVRWQIVPVPERYVASEASALVHGITTGDFRPTGRAVRPWQQGVWGRPTLLDNAETLAQVAVLARIGAVGFRALGRPGSTGTELITVTGAVARPGVVELPAGSPLGAVLAAVGAPAVGWALVGGLAGGWLDLARHADRPFTSAALHPVGAGRGTATITVLPPGGCVLTETARLVGHLAGEGAGQCGPCMFGLPALAADLAALTDGDAAAAVRLDRRLPVVTGRGACRHPDGVVALAASALHALRTELAGHLHDHLAHGRCAAVGPVVRLGAGDRRW
ncbi:SLBB domain-containing protein [Nakamurella flavida]|uniref:SLBB domain-containing protein n=1 Tax=Nakamurella flavida TaxID=363630 RepID=A0A938YJV9_9ACTN|nr:NADH-ubiquinone oxidoreductase-F iron-sulfur binding region domain-containing protein [Nakamurella flavida]MBM9476043.1 SLBB domain-containing protein [Nakamurella flavida]MDP9777214.1 NADH:ubiquinone oxidoreductase subunit F (NADH-binding) [Nakamurella flavida]